MHFPVRLFSIVMLLAFGSPALAGREVDNGGRVKVCHNDAGEITSVELVDLWEARVSEDALTNIQSGDDPAAILSRMVDRLKSMDPAYFMNLTDEAAYVLATRRILPDEVALDPIHDHDSLLVPRGCKLEQLADYKYFQSLQIVGYLWKRLDSVSQAALYLHEATYKITNARENVATSVKARRLVGWTFSTANDDAFKAFYLKNYGQWKEGWPARCDVFDTENHLLGIVALENGHVQQLANQQWISRGSIDESGKLLLDSPSNPYLAFPPTQPGALVIAEGDAFGRMFDQNHELRGQVFADHSIKDTKGKIIATVTTCDLALPHNMELAAAATQALLSPGTAPTKVEAEVNGGTRADCLVQLSANADARCNDGLHARLISRVESRVTNPWFAEIFQCWATYVCGFRTPAP